MPPCWPKRPHVKTQRTLGQDAPVGSVCPFSFVPKTDRQTEAERLFLRQKQWPAIFLHLLGLSAKGRGLETVSAKDKDPLFLSSWGVGSGACQGLGSRKKGVLGFPVALWGRRDISGSWWTALLPCPHCRDGTVGFPSGLADWQ